MTKHAGHSRSAGVSTRFLSAVLLAAAVFVMGFSLFEIRHTAVGSQSLYEMERERQECDNAIQRLLDGSDYLTTQVEQFVVKGDRRYMDDYWTEVLETKSRDKALEAILDMPITAAERSAAQAGKDESDALIQGEIWAMRMMAESLGIQENMLPAPVAERRLAEKDEALSAIEKRESAVAYVFGPEYSMSKEAIRKNVSAFRGEIANRYAESAIDMLRKTRDTSYYLVGAFVVFFAFFLGVILCFIREVAQPLMGFARVLDRSGEGGVVTLEEKGSKEIRRFTRAFNALAEREAVNTRRLERMGYVDYLTDVPNRASITEYVSGRIAAGRQPLGLMIIDIDNFKRFNDTYGHATGDRVLKKVARAACFTQTEGRGIAGRLCGEEFIVVLPDADEAVLRCVAEAVLRNVRAISGADVGMPDAADFRVTVSIGGMIWRGETPADFILLLSRADKALYVSKRSGKDRYTLNAQD